MKRILHSALSSLAIVLFASTGYAKPTAKISDKEALNLATEAYIYAYPLVTMDMTRRVMTNVVTPETSHAPMGQFANMQTYPTPSDHWVTTPNADTLYSSGWLDVSKEPYIMHVPDEGNRYYLMEMLSAWTDVFADPGTRTTGTKAHDFAIVGPNWKGTLPKNVTQLKSPTNLVWIIGRTYSTGTPEDYKIVHALQEQYTLVPLSSFGKTYTPPEGVIDSNVDMKTPVRTQVNAMDAATYFKRFAEALKNNPPANADAPMIAKLKKLGIVVGEDFDIEKVDPAIKKALDASIQNGLEKIKSQAIHGGIDKNGWEFSLKVGRYGTDYLQRAFITAVGLGANLPQDAVYPMTSVDSNNRPLSGKNNYMIHFAKEELPPVNAFWSLTMYNAELFFVENDLNRYTLSPRDALQFNKDGSLNLYISHESPGKEKESNWLPAPEGNFALVLRLYWPKQTVLNGSWMTPAVRRL